MIQTLLNVLAPDDCLLCGEEGEILCEWCRLDQDYLPSRCYKCHAQTKNFDTCSSCKKSTNLRRITVCQEYKGTAKNLVKVLKFECKRQAATPIARMLNEVLPFIEIDQVTYVPTAPRRIRQRGFDHTKLIASELAKLRGLPYAPTLVRTNNTQQVGSDKKQRLLQAENTYKAIDNKKVKGKKFLLIDDVVTTGSTLQAATRALKQAGAKKVYCATFAYSK